MFLEIVLIIYFFYANKFRVDVEFNGFYGYSFVKMSLGFYFFWVIEIGFYGSNDIKYNF